MQIDFEELMVEVMEMIMVFCQQDGGNLHRVGLELLSKAVELAKDIDAKVTAVTVGSNISHLATTLTQYGADRVILIKSELLEMYNSDLYTMALSEVVEKEKPEILLIGATQLGRELGPRLAARLKTGLTADCTQLEIDKESKLLLMTRPAFGGNLMATIVCPNHRPQMATVRPGVFELHTPNAGKLAEIVEYTPSISFEDARVVVEEFFEKIKEDIDITQAQVIVSGGRGVGSAEGFEKLRELANLLGGTVAGSRAAVDNGWIDKDRQVGQTGKVVRPKLYIAVGISGAIQHLAGINEGTYIVAINKDADAPIMKVADLGIVGDWRPIINELIKKLSKKASEEDNYEMARA
jgi:electron transfer flavoprotein alpha subunit